MIGSFNQEQIECCFTDVPSLYLEKGSKNSGGKIVEKSICEFLIAEGKADYLTPSFDSRLEKIKQLVRCVMQLRQKTSFQSRLSLVIRTDNSNPMPNFCLSKSIIDLLFHSETEFDLDVYHYENS